METAIGRRVRVAVQLNLELLVLLHTIGNTSLQRTRIS
jgi:hypothetical protein